MALNAAAQTAAGNGLSAVITHLAIHTAAPDAAGSNQSTAARVAVTWTNTAGDLSSGSKNFTDGAASGPATHVGLWGALTGGTFYGWYALTGDQTFNAAGEYTITQVTLDSTVS